MKIERLAPPNKYQRCNEIGKPHIWYFGSLDWEDDPIWICSMCGFWYPMGATEEERRFGVPVEWFR